MSVYNRGCVLCQSFTDVYRIIRFECLKIWVLISLSKKYLDLFGQILCGSTYEIPTVVRFIETEIEWWLPGALGRRVWGIVEWGLSFSWGRSESLEMDDGDVWRMMWMYVCHRTVYFKMVRTINFKYILPQLKNLDLLMVHSWCSSCDSADVL